MDGYNLSFELKYTGDELFGTRCTQQDRYCKIFDNSKNAPGVNITQESASSMVVSIRIG